MTADNAETEAPPEWAVEVAKRFHWHYEQLARDNAWETQKRSQVEWDRLPEANRATMIATVLAVFQYDKLNSDGPNFWLWFDAQYDGDV